MEKPTAIAVIAKYKEKITWLDELHKLMPSIIYNKGDKEDPNHLPNIPWFDCRSFKGVWHAKTPTGREAHTYLYHIIKNYPHFPEITFFTQAEIDDHNKSYIELFKFLRTLDLSTLQYLHLGSPEFGLDTGGPLHLGVPVKKFYDELFDEPCPSHFLFHLGACFMVNKSRILSRPLEFYERAMQLIYEEPLSGYALERLWDTIFNSSVPSKRSYPPVDRSTWQFKNL